jgi:hypothetical protein
MARPGRSSSKKQEESLIAKSEDEPMLSVRIGTSFLTILFRHAYPGGFQLRVSGLQRAGDRFLLRSSKFGCDGSLTLTKEMKYESNRCPPIWRSGSTEVRGVPRSGRGSRRSAGAGRCHECKPDRLQAACRVNERLLSHHFSGTDRSRRCGDRGEDWAGSGGLRSATKCSLWRTILTPNSAS